MARRAVRGADKANPIQLRVYLNPATESVASDPLRLSEIADLVAQIVLLGRSRRRVSKREREEQNAA